MPKKSLYIPDAIDAIIGAGEGESYSGRVSYLVALADAASREVMPELVLGEWIAIATAVRDCQPVYERGPAAVLRDAWNGVLDTADHSVGDWAFDEAELVKRLKAMPLAAQAAAFEVGRGFWHKAAPGGSQAQAMRALRDLGARIAPEPR